MEEWLKRPHRRFNPLTREWVLVSPQRATRPWQGQLETSEAWRAQSYDPTCYLCPENTRAGGVRNPAYTSTFVFDNDFPALVPEGQQHSMDGSEYFVAETERGICRVVCFSPRHDLTIPQMEVDAIECVIEVWRQQVRELESLPWVRFVQIFENRGAMMGASNPHPHGQIWASEHIPNEISKEVGGQHAYFERNGACLLCAYGRAEASEERLVCANASFSAVVPFWAIWPFEILVVPARHFPSFEQIDEVERKDLAEILHSVTQCYDALFSTSFPYSMGFHPAPAQSNDPAWHFHAHFYPPLLRSATVRKFMVGYELLANAQRDVTPEMAAEQLRNVKAR